MGKGLKYAFLQRRHARSQQVRKHVCSVADHQGHADQNHTVTSHLLEWPSSKRDKSSRGKSLNKRELLITMSGRLIHPLLTIARSSKTLRVEPPYDPAIPLWVRIQREWVDLCTPVFTAASVATAETRKQPVSPSQAVKPFCVTPDWRTQPLYIRPGVEGALYTRPGVEDVRCRVTSRYAMEFS